MNKCINLLIHICEQHFYFSHYEDWIVTKLLNYCKTCIFPRNREPERRNIFLKSRKTQMYYKFLIHTSSHLNLFQIRLCNIKHIFLYQMTSAHSWRDLFWHISAGTLASSPQTGGGTPTLHSAAPPSCCCRSCHLWCHGSLRNRVGIHFSLIFWYTNPQLLLCC